ncbi:hypothetical protein GCM10022221_68350 [Actinocorallia aurea]
MTPDEVALWAASSRSHMRHLAVELDDRSVDLQRAVVRLGRGSLLLLGVDKSIRGFRMRDRILRAAEAQRGVALTVNDFAQDYATFCWADGLEVEPLFNTPVETPGRNLAPLRRIEFDDTALVHRWCTWASSHMQTLGVELDATADGMVRHMDQPGEPWMWRVGRRSQGRKLRRTLRRAASGQRLAADEIRLAWAEFAPLIPQHKSGRRTA